ICATLPTQDRTRSFQNGMRLGASHDTVGATGAAVTELSHQPDSHAPCHESNTGYFLDLNSFALAAGMDRGTMVRLSNGTS
ncbi:hypothetical protein RX880_24860, partial [Pseudomonas syringae pv. actinidiae]|nr:hypothetical protein [Pseudomonas syringae pv. actinidiae]